jgi:hypothetical protein
LPIFVDYLNGFEAEFETIWTPFKGHIRYIFDAKNHHRESLKSRNTFPLNNEVNIFLSKILALRPEKAFVPWIMWCNHFFSGYPGTPTPHPGQVVVEQEPGYAHPYLPGRDKLLLLLHRDHRYYRYCTDVRESLHWWCCCDGIHNTV